MAETLANWITAAATLGAVVAAIWAGLIARRVYAIEQRRDRDREEAQERSQAELIASWVSWSQQPDVRMPLPDGTWSRASLALQNASAVPVYDVEVNYSEGGRELGNQQVHVLSPTGSVPHYREIKCEGVGKVLMEPRDRDARLDLRVTVTFTDARGTRWTRQASGLLERNQ